MNDIFAGFVVLGETMNGVLLVTNTSDTPIDADALPTFRVYGPDGFMVNGSGTVAFLDSGVITDATNASPIVITSEDHGLTTGARVTISGVGGNTAANTTAVVTSLTADTFSIPVAGNGAYTSGGVWHVTGAYSWEIDALEADGYAAGVNYNIVFSFAISSTAKGCVQSLQVA